MRSTAADLGVLRGERDGPAGGRLSDQIGRSRARRVPDHCAVTARRLRSIQSFIGAPEPNLVTKRKLPGTDCENANRDGQPSVRRIPRVGQLKSLDRAPDRLPCQ